MTIHFSICSDSYILPPLTFLAHRLLCYNNVAILLFLCYYKLLIFKLYWTYLHPNRSSPSTPPILSLNAPSPQPSSFPSPLFPSPQPTLVPPITNSKFGEKEKTADGCQPSKKRKTVVYRNKSTHTETISTKVPETCNVCLTTQERGHWVGCDRTRCGYWVHNECMGFYFSSKTVVKIKLNVYVACTDKQNNCYICIILYNFFKYFLLYNYWWKILASSRVSRFLQHCIQCFSFSAPLGSQLLACLFFVSNIKSQPSPLLTFPNSKYLFYVC